MKKFNIDKEREILRKFEGIKPFNIKVNNYPPIIQKTINTINEEIENKKHKIKTIYINNIEINFNNYNYRYYPIADWQDCKFNFYLNEYLVASILLDDIKELETLTQIETLFISE